MNEKSIILSRILSLNQCLDQINESIKLLPDDKLVNAMQARFSNLINPRSIELKDLADKAQKRVAEDKFGDEWEDLRKCSGKCTEIFREYLAYFEGGMLRSTKLNKNNICKIADGLLYYLGSWSDTQWNRFTIMAAEGESISEMTNIIRIRFPELDIWNFPLIGHEFGHYAAPLVNYDGKLSFREIFQECHKKEELSDEELYEEEKEKLHKQEYLADVLGTYVLGPAFALTFLLLRLNPKENIIDNPTHPSNIKRAYCIVRMLEEMDNKKEFGYILKLIKDLWDKKLESCELSGIPWSSDHELRKIVRDWNFKLINALPNVKYENWSSAVDFSDALNPKGNNPLDVVKECTLPHIINAAWICRIKHANGNGRIEDDSIVQAINERALDLCLKTIDKEGARYAPGWSR